ncbi:MAG: hypothetical protein S4CHLAM6_08300 [Chlamydiae bacterium]|nr:hypothetical protein [Chlamydiota bacterium]
MNATAKKKYFSEPIKKALGPPPGFSTGLELSPQLTLKLKQFIEEQERYSWIENNSTTVTRSTINYGWNYVDMERGKFHFVEIPSILYEVRQQLVTSFCEETLSYYSPEDFDNIIVTIYDPGQFLIPHYDVDNSANPLTKRNFYFEEPILGLVVEADPSTGFTFYHHEGEGRPSLTAKPIYQVPEKAGTVFLIQGPSRHAPYFHGIPPTKSRRISVTMRRTVLPGK